jgi:ketosteroid isomerase-like protein
VIAPGDRVVRQIGPAWAILGGVSQENVEVVLALMDALRARDDEEIIRRFDADASWHNTAAFPGERTCVGPRAIIDFWATLSESFAEGGGRLEIERVADGGDRVVLAMRSRSEGRTSGIPVDVRWCIVSQVRDGRVRRVDVHGSWEKALQAAGLDG